MPYPLLIDVEACEYSLLDSDEHEFLAEFISVLDDQLLISARRAGVHFVEDALFAFDDEQICDGDGPDDSAMNVINVNPVNGSLVEPAQPDELVPRQPAPQGARSPPGRRRRQHLHRA